MGHSRDEHIDKVVFYYAYAHLEHDAVSKALNQLAARLSELGTLAQVFSIQPRKEERRFSRARHQFRYLFRALGHMLAGSTTTAEIVTVDVPTGIGLVGALAARARGRRHVSLVMDLYQFQGHARVRNGQALRRFVDRLSLRSAGKIVTLGDCMSARVRAISGRSSVALPIWQDPTELRETEATALRVQLGIAETTRVVLYSGHAGAQHPLLQIAGAIVDLPDFMDVLFVVAAHGTNAQLVARAYEGSARVRMIPAVPRARVSELLSLGDLHVVSLSDDATGTCVPSKTYAAMAASRPVLYVGSSQGQAAADVIRANAGAVVDLDRDAIATTLMLMLSDPGALRKMGEAGRAFLVSERSDLIQAIRWRELVEAN